MRARGVCLVWLAACSLAIACGSDTKKPGGTGASGDDAGGAGAEGGTGANGSGADGGATDGGTNSGGTAAGGSNGGGTNMGGSNGGTAAGDAGGSAGDGGSGAQPPSDEVTFTVNANDEERPISPLIYGANQPGLPCDAPKARFTFCRDRSRGWSTYNWETNASNAGQENCSENNDALSASSAPGAAVVTRVDEAEAVGAASVVAVPMLGYVAADKNGGSDAPDCSGDVSKTTDYLNTRLITSRARKGAELSPTPDTTDGWVNQDEMVAFLKSERGEANVLFTLDSQPELWHLDHEKLRSQALSYDQHVELSATYAATIKDNWPGAPVIGLVGYGFLAGYSFQTSPDFSTKGEYLAYFLEAMSERSDEAGKRLLDYVDLHWLTEVAADNQRLIYDGVTPAAVAARVQAPRSLWDPTFVEDSWIPLVVGGPVELLTWLKGEVDDNYPGTQLAVAEWAFGGVQHISGAIAAADALGIYGQRGVGLAGAVSFGEDSSYLLGAFQAYRNYDGEGSEFGDTSVAASSSNVSRATIYASKDSNDDDRMVLIAINRVAEPTLAKLSIEHSTAYTSLAPYCITDGHPEPVAGTAIASSDANAFSFDLPGYSVCVLVPTE